MNEVRATPGKLVHRIDSMEIDKAYFTDEGYLMDMPVVTTTGIFEYRNADGSVRRELRLPEHVFEPGSLASYKGKPIIITHNAGIVDSSNVQREIIGTILSEGVQDGDSVKVQVCIHNTEAMKNSGLKELSLGYALETDETPGIWNGQPYDAIQKNIRINHLALVGTARAGETARLNIDSKDEILKGGKVEMSKTVQKVMTAAELKLAMEAYNKQARLDGDVEITIPAELLESGEVSVTETEPGAEGETAADATPTVEEIKAAIAEGNLSPEQMQEYINVLLGMVGENTDGVEESDTPQDEPGESGEQTTPVKENEEVKTDSDPGEENKEKNKTVNMDSAEIQRTVDAMVTERLGVCRIGEKLGLDLQNKPVMDAKREVIAKTEPNVRLDGLSDEAVNGMYLMAKAKVESMKSTDVQRQQMFNADGMAQQTQVEENSAASARQRMIDRMGGNQ